MSLAMVAAPLAERSPASEMEHKQPKVEEYRGQTTSEEDRRGGTLDGRPDARSEETCVLACGGRWGRWGRKGASQGATTFKNASHSTQLRCDLIALAAVRLFFSEV